MKAKLTILFLFSLFIFNSCHKVTNQFAEEIPAPRALGKASASKAVNLAYTTNESVYMDSNIVMEAEESIDNSYETGNSDYERKLIRTGYLTIEVESISDIEKQVSEFAESLKGYITNSSMYENHYEATVKIPLNLFNQAMTSAGDIGKVKSRSVNSQDVTEQFYDLQTRLETKKVMQKKLETYLAAAKDIKDLLEVERQLNNVTSEIESMEGRMKRLSNQIDFSTIYLSASLPTGYVDTGFKWPDVNEKVREFAINLVNFLFGLLMFIFYAFVFGVPVLAVAAFFFWILFGKVGLLIKLFNWLKWKKK